MKGSSESGTKDEPVKVAVCHKCHLNMNTITFREFTVLLCPRCEGTFYDESDLPSLLQQPDLRLSYLRPALLANLATPHPEEVDRALVICPVCTKPMKREFYDPNSSILVDRCLDGHGIWLDDGELDQLYTQRESESPLLEPGFWEGLRRLVGLKPRVAIESHPD